jgi:transposase-like protein
VSTPPPAVRPRGRPRALDSPEVQAAILAGIEAGLFLKAVIRSAGISPATFFAWRKRWEAGDPETFALSEFFFRVQVIDARAEIRAVEILRLGRRGWQAQAWFLERRFPSRWARPGSARRRNARCDDEDLDDTTDLADLTDDQLNALAERLGMPGHSKATSGLQNPGGPR